MAWPAIIAAAGSILSSVGSSKAQSKNSASEREAAMALAYESGNQQRRTSAYEMELQDYYHQLDKERKRNARGAMYDQFSGLAAPTREALVADKAPGVPITKPPVTVAATYKKPSLWDRLAKPQLSLDPLGIAGGSTNLRGAMITPGSTTDAQTVRESPGG